MKKMITCIVYFVQMHDMYCVCTLYSTYCAFIYLNAMNVMNVDKQYMS